MARVVATWFYEQDADEGGAYAQVRGDSSSQAFRDVYRRCIAVFFATARRVDPEARLVLYLNRPWDASASPVAAEVARTTARLGVDTEVLPYTFAPPQTWPAGWRNQFFVFDVLQALGRSLDPSDLAVVLDSDVVWADAAASMWEGIRADGALTYRIDYPADHPVNGCSRRALTALGSRLGLRMPGLVEYCGGEYVGARADLCLALADRARALWPGVVEQQARGEISQIEEAHLLSLCYADLGVAPGGADPFVKRMWTQPLKPRNVTPDDLTLPLWHVPAEKKYGLRRLYPTTLRAEARLWSCPDDEYRRRLALRLGIPRNSAPKVLADVTSALASRASGLGRRHA